MLTIKGNGLLDALLEVCSRVPSELLDNFATVSVKRADIDRFVIGRPGNEPRWRATSSRLDDHPGNVDQRVVTRVTNVEDLTNRHIG